MKMLMALKMREGELSQGTQQKEKKTLFFLQIISTKYISLLRQNIGTSQQGRGAMLKPLLKPFTQWEDVFWKIPEDEITDDDNSTHGSGFVMGTTNR